jgi:cyanophycin synthetase
LREGLGWDFCDVAVLLNVQEDHLGLRGVDSLDEMAEVKGVILDQVKESGYGVLNADDPRVMAQKKRISGSVILVSLDYQNSLLREHTAAGNIAVTVTPNGVIQIIHGQSQTPIVHVGNIPATFGGHAIFNVQNALFVIATVYPFIPVEDIRSGLVTFSMNFTATPGRMNVEKLKGGKIIIDYGHNPSALEAQLQLVTGIHKDQGKQGRKAIVFGIPGDRPDQSIINAAKAVAGKYDIYFLKEDWNLRGRKSGEIPRLLKKTLISEGINSRMILTYFDKQTELDAVSDMYNWLEINDIVMLQADDIDKVRHHLFVNLAGQNDKTDETPVIIGEDEPRSYDFAEYVKDIDGRDETSD